MYNVEFRQDETKGPFCCCDQGSSKCQSNLDEIITTCHPKILCDTYFVATLSEKQNFRPWSTMWTSEVFDDSSTRTDVNYTFPFFLSEVPSESVCAYMR